MATGRQWHPLVRTAVRGGVIALAGQGALLVLGRLAARRLDVGDESSTEIRRVLVMGGAELAPTNPALSRVRVDAVMGGAQLDLAALPRVPGGTDVTVRALMGGLRLLVPAGRTVWVEFGGAMGGVAIVGGVQRVTDPAQADVRVHAVAVMGGVGIETAQG